MQFTMFVYLKYNIWLKVSGSSRYFGKNPSKSSGTFATNSAMHERAKNSSDFVPVFKCHALKRLGKLIATQRWPTDENDLVLNK